MSEPRVLTDESLLAIWNSWRKYKLVGTAPLIRAADANGYAAGLARGREEMRRDAIAVADEHVRVLGNFIAAIERLP